MKKFISLLLCATMLGMPLIMGGCKNSEQIPYPNNGSMPFPSNSVDTRPTEATEIDDGRLVPISKMKQDMTASEVIQNCYTPTLTEPGGYEVTSLEIKKEQINNNQRQVLTYSYITATNTYAQVGLNVRSTYNFYDYGGWILDELVIESVDQITPLHGPSAALAKAYLDEHYTLNLLNEGIRSSLTRDTVTYNVTDVTLIDESTSHVYVQFEKKRISITAYVSFILTENGWEREGDDKYPLFNVTDYTADYSGTSGRFYRHNDEYISYTLEDVDITIKSINGTSVEYDLHSFSMYDCRYRVSTGTDFHKSFDPLTGSFVIGYYSSLSGNLDIYVCFDEKNDCWTVKYSVATYPLTQK